MDEDQRQRVEKLSKVQGSHILCHELCQYFEKQKIPKDVAVAGMMNVLLLLVEIDGIAKDSMKRIFEGGIKYIEEMP